MDAIKLHEAIKQKVIDMDKNSDKKIIGYKVNELGRKNEKAIKAISSGYDINWFTNGWNHEAEGKCERTFREAGVHDIWFKPVYDIPEEKFDITGEGHIITIKDDKAFYGTEEITLFVTNLIEKQFHVKSFSIESNASQRSYDIQEVIFDKVGCIKSPTKLSDWRKIYDLIKKS